MCAAGKGACCRAPSKQVATPGDVLPPPHPPSLARLNAHSPLVLPSSSCLALLLASVTALGPCNAPACRLGTTDWAQHCWLWHLPCVGPTPLQPLAPLPIHRRHSHQCVQQCHVPTGSVSGVRILYTIQLHHAPHTTGSALRCCIPHRPATNMRNHICVRALPHPGHLTLCSFSNEPPRGTAASPPPESRRTQHPLAPISQRVGKATVCHKT